MSHHKDIKPTADPLTGAHVAHYYTFDSVSTMNALNDNLKGTVVVAATDVGRVARVGTIAPFDFWVLTNSTGPVWEQLNTTGGGGGGGLTHSESGLLSGGALSKSGAATFDVAAGVGVIIDDVTDPANPVEIPVTFGPFLNVTPSGLATHIFTDLLVNVGGALVQLAGQVPTPAQRRGFIALGKIVHSDLATVILANPLPVVALQPAQGVWDIMQALGPLNVDGNVFGAAGASLLLSKSEGNILEAGANFQVDNQNPSTVLIPASATVSPIFYHHRDGSGGFTISAPQTAVDPNFYDDGSGTLAAVPSNRWTIHRIRVATAGPVFPLYYGQVLYTTFAAAIAAIHDEVVGEPNLNAATVFRGWLIARGGTTDLSDVLNNSFFAAPKFGDGGASSVGVSDHGLLSGLADDDHSQYLLIDGARAMTGALDMGAAAITNVGNVDGRDVSVDGAKLDGIAAGADVSPVASVFTRTGAVVAAASDYDAAQVDFTPDGDIAAAEVQAAIVEVRDDTDTKLAAKIEIGGQLGGTIASPDVRGLRETGGATLLTMGAVADGEVLTRSGTDIIGSAGGGGGLPTFDMLEGFTSGNRYDAAGNGFPGVATGFIVAVLIEAIELNGGQSVLSNISFGVDGWQVNVEANGAFQGTVIDTAGGTISVTGPTHAALSDPIGSHPAPKHWFLVMEVIQNGANNDVALWVNGQKLDTGVGTSPYAPRTAAPSVGTGAFGNVAEFTGISGFAYIEGTRTDDQLRAWFFDVMAAADLVDDDTTGFAVYSVKRGTPAATWLASDGAALTFNRVGALTTINREVPFYG